MSNKIEAVTGEKVEFEVQDKNFEAHPLKGEKYLQKVENVKSERKAMLNLIKESVFKHDDELDNSDIKEASVGFLMEAIEAALEANNIEKKYMENIEGEIK